MADDELERLIQKGAPRFHAVPRRSPARVRQRNDVERMPAISNALFLSDHIGELVERHELLDGELADGNDECGTQEDNFGFEPARTIEDFPGIGHAITAGGILAGKTTADRSHVNAGPKFRLGHSTGALKPAKKGLARRPGKRPPEHRLLCAGSLADADDPAPDGTTGDRRPVHLRAERAAAQAEDEFVELVLGNGRTSHLSEQRTGRDGMPAKEFARIHPALTLQLDFTQ